MELASILSFLGASVLLTLMPGPDNIFVLTESLTKGQKNGMSVAAGLSLGVLVHTLAAATGLSFIIQKSVLAFSVVKYFGAVYLLYLAYKGLREKPEAVEISTQKIKSDERFIALVKKGFLMNVLNPKVALFFIAFLPQFVSSSGLNLTLQMIILGLIFMVQAFLLFVLIAYLSGKLSPYLNNSRFWKITKWSKVTVLSTLALVLALEKK